MAFVKISEGDRLIQHKWYEGNSSKYEFGGEWVAAWRCISGATLCL